MPKELGDQLRSAREAADLTLEDLAACTKISVASLKAIEDETFGRLPRGVFRRAYLRTYAEALALDADALVRTYVDRWEPPAPLEPPPRLSTWTDERLRALAAAVVVIGVAVASFAVRAVWRATVPATATTAAMVSQNSSSQETPTTSGDSASPEQPLRLQIRTAAACWISATADDRSAVRRLVGPGETVVVDATSRILLRLGDAGAVSITINGERGRALGDRGEPVTVQITPNTYSTLLAGAAP